MNIEILRVENGYIVHVTGSVVNGEPQYTQYVYPTAEEVRAKVCEVLGVADVPAPVEVVTETPTEIPAEVPQP